MASNSFGEILRMTSFGESHGFGVGVVLDGVPARLELAVEDFLPALARRRPGQSEISSARREEDRPEIIAGVFEGRTTGAPVAILVANHDQRSADYEHLRDAPRPGHADQTQAAKYGHRDHRGGGRSSGRETIARVLAGVVAGKILPPATRIMGHALIVGQLEARRFDPAEIERNPMRCADPDLAGPMVELVRSLKEEGDSIGGVIEIVVENPPANLGDPTFGKLKARLADAVLSVGAVTGFAYGAGFETATMRGSRYVADSSHFGGILGGISTGETIRFRAAIKPTSSIGDLARKGRHDPCIVPRVIPVLEAMTGFVLADCLLMQRALGQP
ncbi:MAG: chorismate synthase [Planctomycetes bacterium]|nr:chorismate synthase [Planctomycetota bacterium]